MRIAFLTHQFPGARMGGLGSYTLAAARTLADAGHDVHVYTFPLPEEVAARFRKNAGNPFTLRIVPDLATRVAAHTVSAELASAVQAGGESVYRLAMGALFSEALLADHAIIPFDLVEAPECEGLAVPLMLALRQQPHLPPLAVVTQIHSGAAISRRGNHQADTPLDHTIDALEAAAIVLADGAVAMTNAVVSETHTALHVHRDVDILPLAIPSDPIYTPPPLDGPVLFVGRLERLKGVDMLIQAAHRFLTQCPTARLRFVGPDTPTAPIAGPNDERSMRAWMLQQVPATIAARIEFTGELPPDAVTAQIRAAKFLALPSVVENFSLVAVQAMGIGRTCIFSNDIGTAEMYADTGISFPKGDASALAEQLIVLWQDHERLHALSKAAWTRAAQHFNRDTLLAKQLAFYQRAIARASQQRPDLSAMPPHLAASLLTPLLALTHYVCGLGTNILTPGQHLLRLMNRIAHENRQPHTHVLLYGAGRHTTRLLTEQHLWTSAGHHILALIDDAPRWQNGGTHLGLPVLTRQTALAQLKAAPIPIILSTDTFTHQFWQQTEELRAHGIPVYRLYES